MESSNRVDQFTGMSMHDVGKQEDLGLDVRAFETPHHDHAPDLCVPSSSSESTVRTRLRLPDGAGDSRESCRAMA